MLFFAVTFFISFIVWLIFYLFFRQDRSRYRNCYLLFFALLTDIPLVMSLFGRHIQGARLVLLHVIMLLLLVTPLFLIYNGVVMIRREGRHLSQLLSLWLGILVLLGEIAAFANIIILAAKTDYEAYRSYHYCPAYIACNLFSVTIIYGSVSFLIFMIYTLFLQIIPWRRGFDYVIIHGCGLIDGEWVSKLLQDRLDKAIEVYHRCQSRPVLIPSGGRGKDEKLAEAQAMQAYLITKGIPGEDIVVEAASTSTMENLEFSKALIEQMDAARGAEAEKKAEMKGERIAGTQAGKGTETGQARVALVTSNYHVYRALRYCRRIGFSCYGIGSHVAFYYWPSALIREYIAVHAEKKHGIMFVLGWITWMTIAYVFMKKGILFI